MGKPEDPQNLAPYRDQDGTDSSWDLWCISVTLTHSTMQACFAQIGESIHIYPLVYILSS